MVDKAVADWLAGGIPDRTAKTVEVNEDALRPVLAVIATIALRDLSAHDVRTVSCFSGRRIAPSAYQRRVRLRAACRVRWGYPRTRPSWLAVPTRRTSPAATESLSVPTAARPVGEVPV
jgi:hypothetical protein